MDAPSYYMPYESEYDTGSEDEDDDYDSEDLPDYEDPRIRREYDPRYAIIRTAGPSFNTPNQQLKYQENAPGSNYLIDTNVSQLQSSLLYYNPTKTVQTSLFSLKSSNRDKNVYNSSSYFTLKLPRVYKNVTKFQLVQLSFPNFSNAIADINNFTSTIIEIISPFVTSTCLSSCFNVLHGGSAFTSFGTYESTRVNSSNKPMYIRTSVPEGFYDGPALANELNKQMNNTPPFNIISYNDFKNKYLVTQDLTLLFNEPGDSFSTYASGTHIANPSKDSIMNTYYSQNMSLTSLIPTEQEAFVAYYYPILKELIASGRAVSILDTLSYGYELVSNSVLHAFQGLQSGLYHDVCLANQTILDQYRKFHTFEHNLVNKYIWTYDTNLKRFKVNYTTLNSSLSRDITNSRQTIYTNQLQLSGLNHKTFITLQGDFGKYNAIYKDIEVIVSTNLGQSHGISGYSFGDPLPDTLANIHNQTTQQHSTLNGLSNMNTVVGDGYKLEYSGIQLVSNNFSTLHSSIAGYSSIRGSMFSTISSIHGMTSSKHHTYISGKYANVLPQEYINTKTYLSGTPLPVGFITDRAFYVSGAPVNSASETDCETACREIIEKELQTYYSCLPVNSAVNSLAYKLGIWNPISISSLNTLSTLGTLGTLGNFNILMQINTEQSFNNMDIAMNENYNITNETTGQSKFIAAKILTAGLGANDISQTVIQNPVLFDGTLGKLDKLSIQLLLDDSALTPLNFYFPFDLPFTEWDATFQIDEEVALADRNAGFNTIPTVQIPANDRPI